MNHRMRRIVETLACERRYGIADEKGAEYSGKGKTYKESGADTLANFKRVGERRGISPESALMVYLDKHMDSISTAVREANELYMKADISNGGQYDDDHNPRHIYAAGEGIVSRLDDARNYLDLLECLLIDTSAIGAPDDPDEVWYTAVGQATAGLDAPAERQPHQEPGDHPTRFYNPNGIDFDAVKECAAEKCTEWCDCREVPDEPTRTSVGDDDVPLTPQDVAEGTRGWIEGPNRICQQGEVLEGMVQGFDGVWRGRTIVEESVAPGTPPQEPICGPPVAVSPTMDSIRDHRVDL